MLQNTKKTMMQGLHIIVSETIFMNQNNENQTSYNLCTEFYSELMVE